MRVPSAFRRSDISENMMTSMIDVVFLLLIFFVCAAVGQVHEALLPTNLAATGAVQTGVAPQAAEEVRDEIQVKLTADDDGTTHMILNGTDVGGYGPLRRALSRLAEIEPNNPVILDIDGNVTAGEMVRVYDTCRAAHFRSINFRVHGE